jgi:hypothetical protein
MKKDIKDIILYICLILALIFIVSTPLIFLALGIACIVLTILIMQTAFEAIKKWLHRNDGCKKCGNPLPLVRTSSDSCDKCYKS